MTYHIKVLLNDENSDQKINSSQTKQSKAKRKQLNMHESTAPSTTQSNDAQRKSKQQILFSSTREDAKYVFPAHRNGKIDTATQSYG